MDSVGGDVGAGGAGLGGCWARLGRARQTVIKLSLDPSGPRSEQDLALLREQLDQVRASLDRQRGPQHAMMANLSKF